MKKYTSPRMGDIVEAKRDNNTIVTGFVTGKTGRVISFLYTSRLEGEKKLTLCEDCLPNNKTRFKIIGRLTALFEDELNLFSTSEDYNCETRHD